MTTKTYRIENIMKTLRIIFVGLHNKPEMKPLDSLTKSGKLIDRIIKKLPKSIIVLKTNLFNVEYFPKSSQKQLDLAQEWYWTHLPVDEDIIIVCGAATHESFPKCSSKVIKIAHPASKWSHKAMDEYVSKTLEKINNLVV